jgi:addiction module RelB/DinJ family antitoxin
MKTVLNVKTDRETKEEAQKIARDLGLTLSAIVNAYLKQVVRDRDVYYSTAYRMSPKLEKELEKIESDIKLRRNIFGPFNTADEMIEHLESNEA